MIKTLLDDLLAEVTSEEVKVAQGCGRYAGLTFVVTGVVHRFPNRDALKEYVEKEGGKVSGSVSSKTSYLINSDITLTSGKNKKAKELGETLELSVSSEGASRRFYRLVVTERDVAP